MLYFLLDLLEKKEIEWTDEMREDMDGLLNMLDYIDDQIMLRDED